MKCFENTGNFVKVNELETRVKCFRLLKGENELGLKTLRFLRALSTGMLKG